ncbi:hypothetical protein ISN45_Aa05g002360, partial [Arabidopsis thaliana x Arabidopsis arenosa]
RVIGISCRDRRWCRSRGKSVDVLDSSMARFDLFSPPISSGLLLVWWVLESFLVWFGCSIASLVRLGGDSGQFVVRDGCEFQIWFFHLLGFGSGHCLSALVLCFVSNVLENLSFVVRRTRCLLPLALSSTSLVGSSVSSRSASFGFRGSLFCHHKRYLFHLRLSTSTGWFGTFNTTQSSINSFSRERSYSMGFDSVPLHKTNKAFVRRSLSFKFRHFPLRF